MNGKTTLDWIHEELFLSVVQKRRKATDAFVLMTAVSTTLL
jgi:hypothetical protein